MNNDATYPEDGIRPPAPDYMPALGLSRYRDDDLLTKPELARALGCSQRTVQRLVMRFEIPPAAQLGNRKVWVAGDVKRWIRDSAERKREMAEKEAKRLEAYND